MKANVKELLYAGTMIPAHPLALKPDRSLDEFRQRRLTRYYMASGVGGVAVGVHTTQFEIRLPEINLYERVLALAADEIEKAQLDRPFIKVAGICGPTEQALNEAQIALKHGYDIGLLSLGGLKDYSEEQLLEHVRKVAAVIPVFGFYLQPSVGGRIFTYSFWEAFVNIPNVLAIKTAPFNRYQTLDVMRAVCNSPRKDEIAMYTGNDDNIVADLLTTFEFDVNGQKVQKRFAGGLLGHWAAWTQKVPALFEQIKTMPVADALRLGISVTDMNAALFDTAHNFHGCIAGIHEVLRRQGLLEGIWCLNEAETLSPGQAEELTRVSEAYPEWVDDDFVKAFLEQDALKHS
jgi:hypothetical protein